MNLKFIGLCIFIILLFVAALVLFRTQEGTKGVDGVVSGAELVVVAATLTSVVFGIFSFFEAQNIQAKFEKVHLELNDKRTEIVVIVDETRERLYGLSKTIYADMYQLVCWKSEPEAFKESSSRLKYSLIRIELSRGSSDSLMKAMNMAFKEPDVYFLSLEEEIRAKCASLKNEDRGVVVKHFNGLKEMVLRRVIDRRI